MSLAGGTTNQPLRQLDDCWPAVGRAQAQLLTALAELDPNDPRWEEDGYRSLPEWLAARLGISVWAARRWIYAGHALRALPLITDALASGALALDKVLELCRFATASDEARLLKWAKRVTVSTIRRRADVANRPERDDVRAAERERYLNLWRLDDTRLALEGWLPAHEGALVAKALDRLARRLPDIAQDEDSTPLRFTDRLEARRADALVALASAHIAHDCDPERATVVVHAPLDALGSDRPGCAIDDGPPLHPETMRRIGCDCRLEVLLEDAAGNPVGIGRAARNVPRRILRALRYRDGGCTFPGCEAKMFLKAHHIVWWGRGGPTDINNLTLLCHHHHKLVHEGGWSVKLDSGGTTVWFRPDGSGFDPGRAPPRQDAIA